MTDFSKLATHPRFQCERVWERSYNNRCPFKATWTCQLASWKEAEVQVCDEHKEEFSQEPDKYINWRNGKHLPYRFPKTKGKGIKK